MTYRKDNPQVLDIGWHGEGYYTYQIYQQLKSKNPQVYKLQMYSEKFAIKYAAKRYAPISFALRQLTSAFFVTKSLNAVVRICLTQRTSGAYELLLKMDILLR